MAEATVGRMKAVLGLDRRGFSIGLKGAKSEIAAFASQMRGYAGMIGAAMGAAGAGSLTLIAADAMQAATEIGRMSAIANTSPEAFQKMAAAAQSVGISQEQLADGLKDTTERIGEFASTGGGEMKDFFDNIAPLVGVTIKDFQRLSGPEALQLYVRSLEEAGLNQQQMTFYMENMGNELTRMLPVLTNGGERLDDMGRKAVALGAVMSGQTIATFAEARQAVAQMDLAFTGLRNTIGELAVPALVSVADAVTTVALFVREHADTLMTVMQTLAGTAAVVAAIFAGRYAVAVGTTAVRAMVQAVTQSIALEVALGAQTRTAAMTAVAIKGLSAAWGALKAAMISTGIGAIVVASGFLLGKFTELVTATGSFGEAMRLVGDLGQEVWGRIVLGLQAANTRITAAALSVRARMLDVFAAILRGGVEFANRYVGVYRGAFGAVVEIWKTLPAAIGEFAYGAANVLVDAVELMINGVVSRINLLITGLNYVPGIEIAPVADVNLDGIQNPYSGAMREAGAAAAGAFLEGFQTDTFNGEGAALALEGMADDARDLAGNAGLAADALTSLATSPLKSWQVLRDTIKGTGDAAAETLDMPSSRPFAGNVGGEGGDETGASKKARKVKEEVTALQRATEDWQTSWSDGLKGMVMGTESWRDALSGVLAKLSDIVFDSGFNKLWASGLGSIAGSVLGGLGIGSNATGTAGWRGGLTMVNEYGGELMDLPTGTRIIPHDVSMRMAESAGRSAGGGGDIFNIDARGAQEGVADQIARAIQKARPGFVQEAVQVTRGTMGATKKAFGRS